MLKYGKEKVNPVGKGVQLITRIVQEVPFIEGYHYTPAALGDAGRDFFVLLAQPFGGVNHEDDHLSFVNSV